MQAEMEITKKKEEVKGDLKESYRDTEGKQKLLRNVMANEVETKKKELGLVANTAKKELGLEIQSARKDLQRTKTK